MLERMLLVQREKYLKRNSQDAIFYLNAHNIKLLTRDSNEACAVITLWSHFVYKQRFYVEKFHTLSNSSGSFDGDLCNVRKVPSIQWVSEWVSVVHCHLSYLKETDNGLF